MLTPEEILEAADKVRALVQKSDQVLDLEELVRQIKYETFPPYYAPPPFPSRQCPRSPNPCYCDGSCRRGTPQKLITYIGSPNSSQFDYA